MFIYCLSNYGESVTSGKCLNRNAIVLTVTHALIIFQYILHGAAFQEHLKIFSGSEYSGTGSYGHLSFSACNTFTP